jgi:peptidyl-tRNA hydrolase, PTH1 family
MKYLIFGLGNMGPEYAKTRHNAGFMLVDRMAAEKDGEWKSKRYAWRAEVKFKGRNFILLKPTTYMNLSGNAVRYWIKKEKVETDRILIAVDDVALPLGVLRMRAKGGDGGHNGLINIIEQLGTQIFPRLRIGIGDEFHQGYQVNYVLSEFSDSEMEIVNPALDRGVEMIKSFGTIGIQRTMNFFNK